MIYAYPCVLTPAEDGSLIATFPDVPEAITGGADRSEALAMAEDALATALAGYVHEKWDVPVTQRGRRWPGGWSPYRPLLRPSSPFTRPCGRSA